MGLGMDVAGATVGFVDVDGAHGEVEDNEERLAVGACGLTACGKGAFFRSWRLQPLRKPYRMRAGRLRLRVLCGPRRSLW